jgi:hypothetical protein
LVDEPTPKLKSRVRLPRRASTDARICASLPMKPSVMKLTIRVRVPAG